MILRLLPALGLWLAHGSTVLHARDLNACEIASDHRYRATAFYRQRDLRSTISELRQAIRLCPTQPFYEFMLGNALYRVGQLEQSADAYSAFLVSQPDHFEAHMCLGFVSFELGAKKAAILHWTAAVRLDPESPFAHAALAVGLYSVQDSDNARIQYERAMTIDPRYAVPDELAIDIRWKPPVRAILGELKNLLDSESEEER